MRCYASGVMRAARIGLPLTATGLPAKRATSTTAATPSKGFVKIVECPRDAMQGLRDFVPTDQKVRYINALLKVGYDTLDCGSFVSAPAVPQMRDTAEVLSRIDTTGSASKLLVVVCNVKGAEQACEQKSVKFVGYPLSASETFQKKNTRRDIATALEDLVEIEKICKAAGKKLVTYISMGFGNPYGELYDETIVASLIERMAKRGCGVISLADTVGVSEPELITRLYTRIVPMFPEVEIGAHFHSGPQTGPQKVLAALNAGCRRFDGAIGGMGGCPYAKSTLIGNVSTESIISVLEKEGFSHGLDLKQLAACQDIKHDVFGVAVTELLVAATIKNEKAFVQLVLKHFTAADTKGQWALELPDFTTAVRKVYSELGEEPPTDERIKQRFTELDRNKSGFITLDEYMIGVRASLKKRLERKETSGL